MNDIKACGIKRKSTRWLATTVTVLISVICEASSTTMVMGRKSLRNLIADVVAVAKITRVVSPM